MFKKKGENPSHSLAPQKRSYSRVPSSNEGRMFPSHRHHQVGSGENPKEFHRKISVSSLPIRLPPATEKEETSKYSSHRSSGNGENTLHLYECKINLCAFITVFLKLFYFLFKLFFNRNILELIVNGVRDTF